jgi:hypothetical protein
MASSEQIIAAANPPCEKETEAPTTSSIVERVNTCEICGRDMNTQIHQHYGKALHLNMEIYFTPILAPPLQFDF